jgi:hypothetical protein
MPDAPLTFPVSSGLLDPRHVRSMGSCPLFLYLWFVNRVTQDSPNGDHEFLGVVLGGKPVSLEVIARELGISYGTCKRYAARLIGAGYVRSRKTRTGACSWLVTKSKKWQWRRTADDAPPIKPKAIDSRHGPVATLVQELFKAQFSVTCPWDGSEGKALNNLLKANPSWTIDELRRMVRNRFASDKVNGDRPRLWLPNLAKYSSAALDQFQKPKTEPPRISPGQGAMNNFQKLKAAAGIPEVQK